jgi:hypothetical protein
MSMSFLNKRHAFVQMYKCLINPLHPPITYVEIKSYEYAIEFTVLPLSCFAGIYDSV